MKYVIILAFGFFWCNLSAQNYGTIGMPGGTLGGGELDSIISKYNALSPDSLHLTTSGTWYDGPSITIDSGAWLVIATAYAYRISTYDFFARITDKTTHYSEAYHSSSLGAYLSKTIFSIINSSGSKTVYLQAMVSGSTPTTYSLLKTSPNSATGTHISAIKLTKY